MDLEVKHWGEQLRSVHLRVTAPRLAVLAALTGNGQHRDADSIASVARKRLGSLSTQAVYDNLHTLVHTGLVRCIQPAGHPARYELRTGDNHHHIVCRECGLTTDVDCVVGEVPCLTPSLDHGYRIDEAEIVFWGICPACQNPVPHNESETYSGSAADILSVIET